MSEKLIVGSMIIVGAFVSVVLNILKAKYGSLKSNKSKLVLLLLSLGIGGIYHILEQTGTLATAYIILATSSTVYAFFFKK